jgi:outer membrane protein assembly factor BamB
MDGRLSFWAKSGIALIAAALLITLFPSSAWAVPSLTLVPEVRPPGGTLTIGGTGFPPDAAVDIYIDLTHVAVAVPGTDGSFADVTVSVPASGQPGRHFVTAVSRQGGVSAQVSFLVRADWPQFHRTPSHQGYNARENVLSEMNVSDLDVRWRGRTDDNVVSSPAVADGVVYVGSLDGHLYAFPEEGCGGECDPLWTGLVDGPIQGSPAVNRGAAFVTAQDRLYAFDATGCGVPVCPAEWTARVGPVDASPTVAGGSVFVQNRDGTLFAVDADGCESSECFPLWRSFSSGTSSLASPAVAGGIVYTVSGSRIRAFPVSGCDFPICNHEWTTPPLGGSMFGAVSTPSVSGGQVFVTSVTGRLFAFPAAGCEASLCNYSWHGVMGIASEADAPAIGNGFVYATADRKLLAYNASGCGGGASICSALWTSPTMQLGGSAPVIAGSVVYLGAADNRLYAFPDSCGAPVCSPLRSVLTGAVIRSSPAVVNGNVLVGSNDNNVYSLGLSDGVDSLIRPDSAKLARPIE